MCFTLYAARLNSGVSPMGSSMSASKLGMWLFWSLIAVASTYFYLDNAVGHLFGYRSPRFGDTLLSNQLWFALPA